MPEAKKAAPARDAAEPRPILSAAAKRALDEAAARRAAEADARLDENRPEERGGRGGLDPARYGDWEVKGLASDF
jgi:hypothetical protein